MVLGLPTYPTYGCILAMGKPSLMYELKTSSANVKPGMLVIKGTNAYQCDVATATTFPIGWAAYEHTSDRYRPADIDTAYASGDIITILCRGDFVIRTIQVSGAGLPALYDFAVPAAGGKVGIGAALAMAQGSATRHPNATMAFTGSYLPSRVIGRFMDAVDSTSADVNTLVLNYL